MAVIVWVEVEHHEAVFTTVEYIVLGVAVASRVGAKNTLLRLWCLGRDVGHAPRGP